MIDFSFTKRRYAFSGSGGRRGIVAELREVLRDPLEKEDIQLVITVLLDLIAAVDGDRSSGAACTNRL